MGKSQKTVFEGIVSIQNSLPFPLKGIDSDNGSEFLNHHLFRYCEDNSITFTRSRPYMKKDNAHIEQKNWSTVRKILGYERFDSQQQLNLINSLYDNELRLYINFFQPTLKLKEKIRVGSKYKRIYEAAKTPYQRVIDSPFVAQSHKDSLIALYSSLNPVQLLSDVQSKLLSLVSLRL